MCLLILTEVTVQVAFPQKRFFVAADYCQRAFPGYVRAGGQVLFHLISMHFFSTMLAAYDCILALLNVLLVSLKLPLPTASIFTKWTNCWKIFYFFSHKAIWKILCVYVCVRVCISVWVYIGILVYLVPARYVKSLTTKNVEVQWMHRKLLLRMWLPTMSFVGIPIHTINATVVPPHIIIMTPDLSNAILHKLHPHRRSFHRIQGSMVWSHVLVFRLHSFGTYGGHIAVEQHPTAANCILDRYGVCILCYPHPWIRSLGPWHQALSAKYSPGLFLLCVANRLRSLLLNIKLGFLNCSKHVQMLSPLYISYQHSQSCNNALFFLQTQWH